MDKIRDGYIDGYTEASSIASELERKAREEEREACINAALDAIEDWLGFDPDNDFDHASRDHLRRWINSKINDRIAIKEATK